MRYRLEIEPYMPSMSREGDGGVMALFHFGTIVIPVFCQFVLLPVVWLLVLDVARNRWRGGIIATASVWFASISLFASLAGFVDTILEFD